MKIPKPFHLVTDDPHEASLTLFAREAQFLPAFVTLVTEIRQVLIIPTDSRAIAFWSRSDDVLRQTWREQRHRFDCGREWQIYDEIAQWRIDIWTDDDASEPQPPSSVVVAFRQPTSPQIRRTRWS
ncbi:hypothetical protein [Rhizobium sp. SSA_523]|uniref:hypothetical protein n=1 Tax=Rhizobium sp. SSA_523 TaxID=2952477 RepID=UPI0020904A62|nr:hypothetical protein [Rhizobium sp. SSA_523]MCO5734108.1 hypothetical protein [Rhizobium sp. SSA_523]WKC24745.1 hypothetical protein QTJ18_12015 [Rhizobium sp. SSA_523]